MGWLETLKGAGDLIKQGSDAVGGTEGLKGTWDKTKNSDTGKSMSMGNTFRKIGNILDDDVKPEHINISADKSSDMGIFLQTALNHMGHSIEVDGKAGKGTVTSLNTALEIIREENKNNNFNDKLEGATSIKDISELSGAHVHAIQVGIRDRDDISDANKQDMSKLYGAALRDIDNDELKEFADELDPAGKVSSLEDDNIEQAWQQDTVLSQPS